MFDARRTPAPGSGLHQCALCHEDCVVPVFFEEAGDERWHMVLRCGACDTFRDVVIADDVAHAYDRDLSRGMREIRTALDRLDQERMAVETDAFIAALRHDLIDAGDFARR